MLVYFLLYTGNLINRYILTGTLVDSLVLIIVIYIKAIKIKHLIKSVAWGAGSVPMSGRNISS